MPDKISNFKNKFKIRQTMKGLTKAQFRFAINLKDQKVPQELKLMQFQSLIFPTRIFRIQKETIKTFNI